ncbi:Transcriptional regulator, LysR family [Thioalkalivibrio nitratireducens DSM 14787]|uniref:Transcriptional regulator, LysR family n=1 Tax=Thioalkalivibrio nitratireducens (strain DSM 14787 / UNIQEM 213 / ALEN2) TaxID=1255043 RepID=L0DTG9_THIND|nr:LysR family transcriptional regulator [Thioalkalivibrio nitratireducens]AGA32879.1 Transcriptional regulator, LysR family [Thioalkalivibrio nitratireducens DSM 14787]
MPKVTLEQWRMLKAVVEAGGFAKAAERVHKSPSSINHAVQKLQAQLGVALLEVRGRKAELTPVGEALLRRAGHLLDEARDMESLALSLAAGIESVIELAVDQVVPQPAVIEALERFATEFPGTRVQVHETMLDGGPELLRSGRVDLWVGADIPSDLPGEPLGQTRMICVAHPAHSLAQEGRIFTLRDLRSLREVTVRDSRDIGAAELDMSRTEQCWTVGHMTTALHIVQAGFAFAWLPECLVRQALDQGSLVAVALEAGSARVLPFSLVFADRDRAGTATRRLGVALCSVFAERSPEAEAFPDWWSLARCGSRPEL